MVPGKLEAKPGAYDVGGRVVGVGTAWIKDEEINLHVVICVTHGIQEGQGEGWEIKGCVAFSAALRPFRKDQ